MATTSTPAMPFTQELQALKAELQRTLSRLSTTTTSMRELPTSPWSQGSAATTTTTPTTVRSDSTSGRSRTQSEDAARILHELVVTARRRRQVEMHMARELERELHIRDEEPVLEWASPRTGDRNRYQEAQNDKERAIQEEIAALRRRRKQILHEIDDESKTDTEDVAGPPTSPTSSDLPARDLSISNVLASIKQRNDQEYSIEGVVKLESLPRNQPLPETASRPIPSIPQAPTPLQPAHLASILPPSAYGSYRHQEIMQDVFTIQLRFAETMLNLEKSIQMRDQLLIPTLNERPRRRSAHSRRNVSLRRRPRPPSTIYEDQERDLSDSSDDDPSAQAMSTDEASMSEDTMRMWRRYRQRISSVGTARSSPSTGESVATTTTSTSPHSQHSPQATDDPTVASPLASNKHAPTDEHLVTPSTNDSGNKQVRFNETATDDYPTPLIARNISFDQDSIDSTDDDQPTTRRSLAASICFAPRKRPNMVSSSDDEALSFLEGSSVCSADLEDESFLTAFYALRKELSGKSVVHDIPQSMVMVPPTVSTALSNEKEAEESKPLETTASLQEQKRSLVLDIQALTAQLVLAQNENEREQASTALDQLRRQLQSLQVQEPVQ